MRKTMKWVNLSQLILLILFVITVASSVKSQNVADKTLLAFDTAVVVPILAVIIIASLVLSIVMFILQVKKSKKQKKEEIANQDK